MAIASPSGVITPDLHEEPEVLLARLRIAHAHERPAALEPLAPKLELEPSTPIRGDRCVVGDPAALVPDVDMAGAVLGLRDVALEARVVEGMILGAHREAFHAGIGRGLL